MALSSRRPRAVRLLRSLGRAMMCHAGSFAGARREAAGAGRARPSSVHHCQHASASASWPTHGRNRRCISRKRSYDLSFAACSQRSSIIVTGARALTSRRRHSSRTTVHSSASRSRRWLSSRRSARFRDSSIFIKAPFHHQRHAASCTKTAANMPYLQAPCLTEKYSLCPQRSLDVLVAPRGGR